MNTLNVSLFIRLRAAFALLVLSLGSAYAATPRWVELVSPILTSTEKKLYLSLTPAEKDRFEKDFWDGKNISEQQYFERIQYVDSTFGSGKPGSGANTDQGRIYLALGAPTKVSHLPSSRIFVPIEIWYYDTVPGVLQTELHLVFYQKNSLGFLKLYSSNVDTIRVLLLPEASTVHMFGPNDTVDEAAIRNNLRVPPAEDEVINAAVGVANGVKDTENDHILGRITSPPAMLRRELVPGVRSRFVSAVPKLTVVMSRSPYGGTEVDLSVEASVRGLVKLSVFQGETPVYENSVDLKLGSQQAAQYLHRLDLLPGSYRLTLGVDGNPFSYPLEVPAQIDAGKPFRASVARHGSESTTPFEFDQTSFYPSDDGDFVLWQLPQRAEVVWTIRRGLEVVRKISTPPGEIAMLPLPLGSLPPGKYQLEASAGPFIKYLNFETASAAGLGSSGPLISYNANLSPAFRYTLIGEQQILRGQVQDARRIFEKALRLAPLERAEIDMARVEALTGGWDEARARLRPILAAEPGNFDALCVLAYIEAKLQDFEVAAGLYHRALAVHDSPAVRLALAQLHN